jgi:hypothetical protein
MLKPPSGPSQRAVNQSHTRRIDQIAARTQGDGWPIKSVKQARTFTWDGTLELVGAGVVTAIWDAPTEDNPLPEGWTIQSLSDYPDFTPDVSGITTGGDLTFDSSGSDVLVPDVLGQFKVEVSYLINDATSPPVGSFVPAHSGLYAGQGAAHIAFKYGLSTAKVGWADGFANAGRAVIPFFAAGFLLAGASEVHADVRVQMFRLFNTEEFG